MHDIANYLLGSINILFCRYDGARARATSKSTGERVATLRAEKDVSTMNSAFLAWAEEVAGKISLVCHARWLLHLLRRHFSFSLCFRHEGS